MQIGMILPQNEIGDDPEAIRDFSAAAEDEGFKHSSRSTTWSARTTTPLSRSTSRSCCSGSSLRARARSSSRRGSSSCRSARPPLRPTGGGGRHALRRAIAARPWCWLEPARVRRARRGLPHARQAPGRADPAHAALVDGAPRAAELGRERFAEVGLSPPAVRASRSGSAARARRPCAARRPTAPA